VGKKDDDKQKKIDDFSTRVVEENEYIVNIYKEGDHTPYFLYTRSLEEELALYKKKTDRERLKTVEIREEVKNEFHESCPPPPPPFLPPTP